MGISRFPSWVDPSSCRQSHQVTENGECVNSADPDRVIDYRDHAAMAQASLLAGSTP
jgi:hypothetical protein